MAFNHFKIKYFIIFFSFVHFTTAFVWDSKGRDISTAKNCDFVGNDYDTNQVDFPEVCADSCRNDPDCTHFSYSARQSKACVLKSSKPILSDSSKYESLAVNATLQGSVCGFLAFSREHFTKENFFTYNCDFVNTKNINNKTTGFQECVDLCHSTMQCTHFTWTMSIQNTGTCLLKTGRVSKQDASYAPHKMCGLFPEKSLPDTISVSSAITPSALLMTVLILSLFH